MLDVVCLRHCASVTLTHISSKKVSLPHLLVGKQVYMLINLFSGVQREAHIGYSKILNILCV